MNANAYNNRGLAKSTLNNHQGAVNDYNKAIELNSQIALHYSNRAIANYELNGNLKVSCQDIKKAASLGLKYRINYLSSEKGRWCREM